MNDFTGAKAAFLHEDKLLVFLRDDKPDLRFANMWDFPGGGREGDETPIECLARELKEEFGLDLREDSILWQKEYPAMHDASLTAFFFVASLLPEDIEGIDFGDEGQRWELMATEEFFTRQDVVPHLKVRFQDYLDAVQI